MQQITLSTTEIVKFNRKAELNKMYIRYHFIQPHNQRILRIMTSCEKHTNFLSNSWSLRCITEHTYIIVNISVNIARRTKRIYPEVNSCETIKIRKLYLEKMTNTESEFKTNFNS